MHRVTAAAPSITESELSPRSGLSLSPSPSLLSVSPSPSPAVSPTISAQLQSVQDDLSAKMQLTDSDRPSSAAASLLLPNPLQTLMTAAVPSPSNAAMIEQAKASMSGESAAAAGSGDRRTAGSGSLRVITPSSSSASSTSAATAAALPAVACEPTSPRSKPKRRHSVTSSFLTSSPSASPTFHAASSPFMSISSPLTPVTATTASSSSVGSARPAAPLSPLSPFTPSYAGVMTAAQPAAPPPLSLNGWSEASLSQQLDSALQQLQRELTALHAFLVPAPTAAAASAQLHSAAAPSASLPARWQHVALPLSPKPLRLLSNVCRDLLSLRLSLLNAATTITQSALSSASASPSPPSLFDSDVSALHRFAVSSRYWRSEELRLCHDIVVSVLGSAYARATSNLLPMKTREREREEEEASGKKGAAALSSSQCVNGCGAEARVSIVLPCLHLSCWDCLGKQMREKAHSCRRCAAGPAVSAASTAASYASTAERGFVLDENEALLLSSQYILSSYSLPSSSPVMSPLLFSQPSPSPPSAALSSASLHSADAGSGKKRRLSAAARVNVYSPLSPSPATPPAAVSSLSASSAFTRRPPSAIITSSAAGAGGAQPSSAASVAAATTASAFSTSRRVFQTASPGPLPLTLSPGTYSSPLAAYVSSGPWSPVQVGAAAGGGLPAFSLSSIPQHGGGAGAAHHAQAYANGHGSLSAHHPPLQSSPPPYHPHARPLNITVTGPAHPLQQQHGQQQHQRQPSPPLHALSAASSPSLHFPYHAHHHAEAALPPAAFGAYYGYGGAYAGAAGGQSGGYAASVHPYPTVGVSLGYADGSSGQPVKVKEEKGKKAAAAVRSRVLVKKEAGGGGSKREREREQRAKDKKRAAASSSRRGRNGRKRVSPASPSSSSSSSSSGSGASDAEEEEEEEEGAAAGGSRFPYSCKFPSCSDSFKTRFSLKRHSKKHSGEKPFRCSYHHCLKAFAEKSTLKRHLRIHTGEKPYQCSVPGCGKFFADRTNVKRHEMIHSGERPYWCGEEGCKRGYFWRKHLRKHLLSVHGVVYQPQQQTQPADPAAAASGATAAAALQDEDEDEDEEGMDEMDEDEDSEEDEQQQRQQHAVTQSSKRRS